MSSFTCALSGEPLSSTTEEIVATPSGHICLKRLLLTKLSENGGMDPFEPIRERPLSEDQLISLNNKSVAPPRPQATSLPNLLGVIQKEYDALVLELFDTRKALEDTRRELSQALYQNDAATRVVARLAQERDASRQELQNWNASVGTSTAGAAEATAPATVEEPTAADDEAPPSKRKRVEEEVSQGPLANDIPESHLQQMIDAWDRLHKERKPMLKAAATKALSPDQLATLKEVDSKSCHDSRTKSVTAMAGCGGLIVTAARDKNVIVYDTAAKMVKEKVSFGAIVTSVDVNETTFVAASGTKVVVYSLSDGAKVVGEFQAESAVVDLRLHPTESHVCVATKNGKLSLLSVSGGVSEISVFSAGDTEYTCGALHPDGLIYAAGTKKGQVHMWDFKNKVLASTLQEGDEDGIVAIGFSNNGYHLATAHESAVVRAWDLRKQTTLKVLNEDKTMASVTSLSYDASGKYLAFGGKGGVQITTVKEWGTTGSIDVKNATGIVWCADATLATCSDKERIVRFHGVE